MRQKKLCFFLLLIGFIFGTTSSASGWNWNILQWLCLEDILKLEGIHTPHIPVGCEVIDCCPGCPGPWPIDWRIRLTGDPIRAVILDFENLSIEAQRQLHIKGNAKWIAGSRLQIGKGETILSGFNASGGVRPTVAIPRVIVEKTKLKGYMNVADKDSGMTTKHSDKLEFIVEQMLGKVVVNEFRFSSFLRRCGPTVTPPSKCDTIALQNNATNDNAIVLLDERRNSGCVNDEVLRGNGNIPAGSILSNSGCNSEVVVFSDDDAMALVENIQTWTNHCQDELNVDLTPNLLSDRVTFWIMQGAFANTSQRATTDIARANQLYNTMNCGISFQTVAVNDQTQNQNTPRLLNANCNQMNNLHTQIGFTANQLNVYYLGNPGARGWWCGGGNNTIIIGTGADNESLSHELGHAFSLNESNNATGISNTNLMISGGLGRNHITLGQCFRCNVNQNSTLNTHGIRTGPTRNCSDTSSSGTCPALSLDVVPR